jgi:hypothetical protein
MDPETQNGDFLEKSSNNFYYSLLIYGDHVPELNLVGGIFGEIMVRALWYRNQLHRSDGFRCFSVFSTSKGLPSVHRFHFQRIIQVTRVWETNMVLTYGFLFQVLAGNMVLLQSARGAHVVTMAYTQKTEPCHSVCEYEFRYECWTGDSQTLPEASSNANVDLTYGL